MTKKDKEKVAGGVGPIAGRSGSVAGGGLMSEPSGTEDE